MYLVRSRPHLILASPPSSGPPPSFPYDRSLPYNSQVACLSHLKSSRAKTRGSLKTRPPTPQTFAISKNHRSTSHMSHTAPYWSDLSLDHISVKKGYVEVIQVSFRTVFCLLSLQTIRSPFHNVSFYLSSFLPNVAASPSSSSSTCPMSHTELRFSKNSTFRTLLFLVYDATRSVAGNITLNVCLSSFPPLAHIYAQNTCIVLSRLSYKNPVPGLVKGLGNRGPPSPLDLCVLLLSPDRLTTN